MSTSITNKHGPTSTNHPIAHHLMNACDEACKKAASTSPSEWLKTQLAGAVKSVRNYFQCRQDRQAFQTLMGLEDAALKDIGVTRADVLWANQLPLSQNAAVELKLLSLQNKRH